MKPVPLDYYRPASLNEALELLRGVPGAKILAGGQSLMPLLNLRLARPSALVDINRLGQLEAFEWNGSMLRIGCLVRHATLIEHPLIRQHAPLLTQATQQIGHLAIRNRGSLGGSLAHADPAAELPAALLALGADLILAQPATERRVPAEAFFLGPFTTALEPSELLQAVEVPPQPSSGWAVEEFARRPGDFALAGAAVQLGLQGDRVAYARVVVFGVADRPLRRPEAEALLSGVPLRAAAPLLPTVARGALADLAVVADIHASAEYRRALGRVVVERALRRALASVSPGEEHQQ